MSNTPDISRIIQLIMENPGLIEEISNLAKADSESTVPETKPEPIAPLPEPETPVVPTAPASTDVSVSNKARRAQLLGALKSYVSEERGRAIDSMLSVAEILEVMKTR